MGEISYKFVFGSTRICSEQAPFSGGHMFEGFSYRWEGVGRITLQATTTGSDES